MNDVEVMLFLLLLICCGVNGNVINSCNRTISIHCSSPLMCITSVNVTSSITKNIIEECNAHQDCQLQNMDKQCMNITYWCTPYKKIEEFDKFFQPEKVNVSLLGLVTRGYKSKKSQKAENVKCILTLQEHGNADMTNVSFSVKEFAPFSNSTDYCLYVKDSEDPLICSGSGKFYQSYGPYKIENNFHFSMRLSENATTVPEIRVWIDIAISPAVGEYQIQCNSQSGNTSSTPIHHIEVSTETITGKPTSTIRYGVDEFAILVFTVGCVLVILFVTGACVTFCYFKCRDKRIDLTDEIYCDINEVRAGRRPIPQPNYSVRNFLPEISLDREIVENVWHGSFNTIQTENLSLRHFGNNAIVVHEPRNFEEEDQNSESSFAMEIVDNEVYGSKEMLGNLDSDDYSDTEIEDNAIFGSEIPLHSLDGESCNDEKFNEYATSEVQISDDNAGDIKLDSCVIPVLELPLQSSGEIEISESEEILQLYKGGAKVDDNSISGSTVTEQSLDNDRFGDADIKDHNSDKTGDEWTANDADFCAEMAIVESDQ